MTIEFKFSIKIEKKKKPAKSKKENKQANPKTTIIINQN